MTLREIVTTPDPVLRQRARKVRSVTKEVETLIDDMVETMRAAPGIGLAAPQIGISQRVIIVEVAEESDDPDTPPKPAKLYAVVNPEIVRHSADTNVANEGCLSIPGYLGQVERYDTVTIKGLNRHGKPFRLKAKGWLGRVFQHEIDHLEGILYIDRATEMYRLEEHEEVSEAKTTIP